ncbi:GNAT family N-acetyltransferase [Embleya scabrispora]|uniref:GNAT family N-acetyltransferase n=1 Tax=Embleya scabrispora TaxID=159449 RepID=UPI00036BF088|nr:GNAT family protein [Embleya scabrispora]MYS80813.1 GNAT family N-acetyltransferase [Streptomyces sp. SID5474]
MSGDQLSLRPVAEADISVLERFLIDPEAVGPFAWYGWSDPGGWRRQWAENGLIGDDRGLLLVVRGSEVPGFVAWRKIATSRTAYCWNVGINLFPEARGQGIGTRAQLLLVRYLFAHTQVARIEAGTELDNLAEQRALEKVGFTREGVARAYTFRDGRWRDVVFYSMLRDELAPATEEFV